MIVKIQDERNEKIAMRLSIHHSVEVWISLYCADSCVVTKFWSVFSHALIISAFHLLKMKCMLKHMTFNKRRKWKRWKWKTWKYTKSISILLLGTKYRLPSTRSSNSSSNLWYFIAVAHAGRLGGVQTPRTGKNCWRKMMLFPKALF